KRPDSNTSPFGSFNPNLGVSASTLRRRHSMKLLLQMLVVGVLTACVTYGALSLWHRSPAEPADTALATALTPMQSALAVAQTRGCRACHSIDGSDGVGPTW